MAESPFSQDDLQAHRAATNANLSLFNDELIKTITRHSTALRTVFVSLATQVDDKLQQRVHPLSGTELDAWFVDLNLGVHGAVDALRLRYTRHYLAAIRRAAREIASEFRSKGINLTAKVATTSAEARVDWFRSQIEQRLLRIDNVMYQTLSGYIRENPPARASDLARASLLTPVGGPDVEGGGLLKAAQRTFITDAHAIARAARLAVYRTGGVGWAYWRLSGAHRLRGKVEVCEQRASASLDPLLYERHGGPPGASLEGLYPLDAYPELPHPFCRCWPEPLLPA